MRGRNSSQISVVCLFNLESAIPDAHPIRRIKRLADEALRRLELVFSKMYAETGRPSVPPERLLLASVLMALYSVRSERMFCERLGYDLLFRWFLDMGLDEGPFDPTCFGKNRARLMEHEVAKEFFTAVVEIARAEDLISSEHFSVDGTLIEAWASLKSFRPKGEQAAKDSNGWADFRGKKRSNETHASTTDPEARLWRKGKGREAKLCFMGHSLMENRTGLLVDTCVTVATGHAEREAALQMVDAQGLRDGTLGADRGYDTADFVDGCRSRGITPHVAQNARECDSAQRSRSRQRRGAQRPNTSNRRSAVDGRTTRWPGYAISSVKRRLVEQGFGWMKSVGGLRRSRLHGVAKTQMLVHVAGAAYNLLRLARLVQ
jgi:transposase/IS5 family transposase